MAGSVSSVVRRTLNSVTAILVPSGLSRTPWRSFRRSLVGRFGDRFGTRVWVFVFDPDRDLDPGSTFRTLQLATGSGVRGVQFPTAGRTGEGDGHDGSLGCGLPTRRMLLTHCCQQGHVAPFFGLGRLGP